VRREGGRDFWKKIFWGASPIIDCMSDLRAGKDTLVEGQKITTRGGLMTI